MHDINSTNSLLEESQEETRIDIVHKKEEMKLLTKEAVALFVLHENLHLRDQNNKAKDMKIKLLKVYDQLAELIQSSEFSESEKAQLKEEFQEDSINLVKELGKNDDEYSKFLKKYASDLIISSFRKRIVIKKILGCVFIVSVVYLASVLYHSKLTL